MNNNLAFELTKLEDYEFRLLEHHLRIARMVRDTMSQNAISEKTMASKLEVPQKRMKEVINGSYPFDLKILSKLQSFQQEIESEKIKLKIEADGIGFATYKHQFPIYIDRIEKLLDILEGKKD